MLQRAGIRFVQPGLESLSSDVLRLMRKGVTAAQNIQLLKWCKELGVKAYWNILWGFPGEAPESYLEMARLIPLLVHLQPPLSGGPIQLQRFSPLFDHANAFGFTNVRPNRAFSFVYHLSEEHAANIAYHFDFDYRNRQDPREYTRVLVEQIHAWKTVHETADLFWNDENGVLHVWDFRPVAREQHIRIEGDQRLCYLECDQARSPGAIAAHLERDVPEIERLLKPLVELGLIINIDNVYLSLAIPLGDYQPERQIVEKLWTAVMGVPAQFEEVS
jgi:hypothetical protein